LLVESSNQLPLRDEVSHILIRPLLKIGNEGFLVDDGHGADRLSLCFDKNGEKEKQRKEEALAAQFHVHGVTWIAVDLA
jgi:hypothetical protein